MENDPTLITSIVTYTRIHLGLTNITPQVTACVSDTLISDRKRSSYRFFTFLGKVAHFMHKAYSQSIHLKWFPVSMRQALIFWNLPTFSIEDVVDANHSGTVLLPNYTENHRLQDIFSEQT